MCVTRPWTRGDIAVQAAALPRWGLRPGECTAVGGLSEQGERRCLCRMILQPDEERDTECEETQDTDDVGYQLPRESILQCGAVVIANSVALAMAGGVRRLGGAVLLDTLAFGGNRLWDARDLAFRSLFVDLGVVVISMFI